MKRGFESLCNGAVGCLMEVGDAVTTQHGHPGMQ